MKYYLHTLSKWVVLEINNRNILQLLNTMLTNSVLELILGKEAIRLGLVMCLFPLKCCINPPSTQNMSQNITSGILTQVSVKSLIKAIRLAFQGWVRLQTRWISDAPSATLCPGHLDKHTILKSTCLEGKICRAEGNVGECQSRQSDHRDHHNTCLQDLIRSLWSTVDNHIDSLRLPYISDVPRTYVHCLT